MRNDFLLLGFVAVLLTTAALLGSAITGYVSMYCADGDCTLFCGAECSNFCSTNQDCLDIGEVCCEEADIGVCKSECDKPYVAAHQPPPGMPPTVESPAELAPMHVGLFVTAILAFIFVTGGYIWISARRK